MCIDIHQRLFHNSYLIKRLFHSYSLIQFWRIPVDRHDCVCVCVCESVCVCWQHTPGTAEHPDSLALQPFARARALSQSLNTHTHSLSPSLTLSTYAWNRRAPRLPCSSTLRARSLFLSPSLSLSSLSFSLSLYISISTHTWNRRASRLSCSSTLRIIAAAVCLTCIYRCIYTGSRTAVITRMYAYIYCIYIFIYMVYTHTHTRIIHI